MLRIVTLVENTAMSKDFRSRHGLSLYIETEKHRILFDAGPDDTFARNAQIMGIDLSAVDTVILSHGHVDHGGGLKKLMEINQTAKIHIRKTAFDPHRIRVLGLAFNVGLDPKLLSEDRFVATDDISVIDDELTLFSGVRPKLYPAASNHALYALKNGRLTADDFAHEQSLIIRSRENRVLICGCAHAGIINIMNKAESVASCEMSAVIGGFHLYNPPTRKYESQNLIQDIAKELAQRKAFYCTGHCTGPKAFAIMKPMLGQRLKELTTGSEIILPFSSGGKLNEYSLSGD